MGIVVDLQRSGIVFADPLILAQRTAYQFNTVDFEMHSFEITFGISFDPDPAKGIGGAPKAPESWTIGIVQNLLAERADVEFDGRERISVQFNDPADDVVPKATSKPFYGDPDLGPGKRQTRPYSNIFYTSQGYGQLLDPFNQSGYDLSNKPDALNMWDQPGGGAWIKSPKTGAFIKSIERKYVFQTWLVAQTPGNKAGVALAHIPPFTLCFWFETDLTNFHPRSSFDMPSFDYGVYVEDGFSPLYTKVDRRIKGLGPTPNIRAALGNGRRNPYTKGATALERKNIVFKARGLPV